MGEKEHLKSFASISEEGDKNEITKDDVDKLSVLLSEQGTLEGKNDIVESLDYNISKEDKDKLSLLLRNKLGLVDGNNVLSADKTEINSFLYKALIWVENEGLAENVLEKKEEVKFKELPYGEKIKYLDSKYDKENSFNEEELIGVINDTRDLFTFDFDKKNIKGSLLLLKNKYDTILENNFDKIFSGNGTNEEKILELNKMYKEINNFKEENERDIIRLKEESKKTKLTKIQEIFKKTNNPFKDIGNGFVVGAIDVLKGSNLGINISSLLEVFKKEGLNILTLMWDGLVKEFYDMGKDLKKIFNGGVFEGARIIGRFLVKILKKIILGAVLGPIGTLLTGILNKLKVTSKIGIAGIKKANDLIQKETGNKSIMYRAKSTLKTDFKNNIYSGASKGVDTGINSYPQLHNQLKNQKLKKNKKLV